MSIPTDDELEKLYEVLPQQWFMIEPSKIHFFEKFAQGTPKNLAVHRLLVFYFHLSGDVEKCAFYALHGGVEIDDQLILTSVETACLDFVIYKQGGGVHGSACVAAIEDADFNQTKTKTRTLPEEERRPFELLEELELQEILDVADRIVARSSPASEVSWKVHSKTLKASELHDMSDAQLSLVFRDVQYHNDALYRETMLKTLLEIYSNNKELKNAVDCLVELRSTDAVASFFVSLLNEELYSEALQAAFCIFEEAPEAIVSDSIYCLRGRFNEILQPRGTEIALLIVDKALTGRVGAALQSDFVRRNYCLDKVALRKIMQGNNGASEELAAYGLMLALMTLGTGYYEHRGNLVEKQRYYCRLGYFGLIGLVYRGAGAFGASGNAGISAISGVEGSGGVTAEKSSASSVGVYDAILRNFNSTNPYEIGGALMGLGLQFAGLNTTESSPLGLLMDVNGNELDSRNAADQGPIIHGMAMAMGLIALGTHDEELVKIVLERFGTDDVDAKFAILIAIGLIMLGNAEFFENDIVCDNVKPFLACEHEKLRRGSAICLALLCYKQENAAENIIYCLQNFAATDADQFTETAAQLAPFAIGLAYAESGNIAIAQRLLLVANSLSRTSGAQAAIEAIGLVFTRRNISEGEESSLLRLLTMCTRSFDPQIRAGGCRALGEVFACTGHPRAVELLCKMMSDQEEPVRCAAYIAQALVLETLNGVELPEAQTAENTAPIGDRQKNVVYRCDYENDSAFEEQKNQIKLFTTPGSLGERYKEIYVNKHAEPFSTNEYATQFRRDLAAVSLDVHDGGRETLLTVRAQMVSLGILNCGGLNMSFKQRTDLETVSYALFLQSWEWYPMMGILGLCMECDYVSTVQLCENDIQEIQLVLTIPGELHQKYAPSSLTKDTKHEDVEKYVKKARLSQGDLVGQIGDGKEKEEQQEQEEQPRKLAGGFEYISEMKDIAMEEFAQQASNVRLTDALQQEEAEQDVQDEFKILETPARLVDQQIECCEFIQGTDFMGVFPGVKRGIIVVKEVEYE